jgi:predicted exporter
LLAVWSAGTTSLLSFGLLAFSGVPAVHGFGLTMLIGIILCVAFAPLANRARRRQKSG